MKVVESLKQLARNALLPPHAVILTYHGVLDEPAPFPVWQYLHRQQLEEQFAWLSSHCNCVSVGNLLQAARAGRVKSGTVAVTFDDGFANNLHVALPLLKKYRIPATFFITTGFIGTQRLMWPEVMACILQQTRRAQVEFKGQHLDVADRQQKAHAYKSLARIVKQIPGARLADELQLLTEAAGLRETDIAAAGLAEQVRMMSWEELRTLADAPGIDIGAHTVNHHQLSGLQLADAALEIASSKQILEQRLGAVRYFAYPYGGATDFLPEHRQMVIEQGYDAAFTAHTACIVPGVDPFAVPRLGVGADSSLADIRYALSGGLAVTTGLKFRWS